MLPPGSITGAPKGEEALEIIHEAEGYDRRFYCRRSWVYIIMVDFNSAVMIRFLENDGIATSFARQGGITRRVIAEKNTRKY